VIFITLLVVVTIGALNAFAAVFLRDVLTRFHTEHKEVFDLLKDNRDNLLKNNHPIIRNPMQ
jgi:hypothetical protein